MGMSVGKDTIIGLIRCDWPSKITIGDRCFIEDNVVFKITKPFDNENNIFIGDNVFVGYNCEFNCNSKIIISNNCLIASNTTFVDTGHQILYGKNINEQGLVIAPIIIEEDVWIGTHCVVMKGVKVGKGSIVGAGSVVNREIPANQIWAGVPAKFIRNR